MPSGKFSAFSVYSDVISASKEWIKEPDEGRWTRAHDKPPEDSKKINKHSFMVHRNKLSFKVCPMEECPQDFRDDGRILSLSHTHALFLHWQLATVAS